MNLRSVLVPALVLTAAGGLLAVLLLADPPNSSSDETAAGRDGQLAKALVAETQNEISSAQTSSPAPAAPAPLPGNIRDVSPDGVSAPKVSGGLKRIAPSKRYLELKDPPVEPIPDGPLELVRVQVLDGGRLRANQITVKLAHIIPLEPEETCVSRLGGTWPCGARARTFLRGLIRQFKVNCEKIEELGPRQILATCSRGKIDLSTRLVRYGWADPLENAPDHLQELALKAKERKIGKWQAEWLKDLPATQWENDPTAALPGLEVIEPEIVEWSLRADPEAPEDDTSLFGLGDPAIAPQQ